MLLFSAVILLITSLWFVIRFRSLLFPGAFIPLFWAGWLILCMLPPDYDFPIEGLIWITLSCMTVAFGSELGYNISTGLTNRVKVYDSSVMEKSLSVVVAVCFVGGVGSCLDYYLSSGLGSLSNLSVDTLYRIAHYYSYSRYNNPAFQEPLLATILSITIYIGAFAGGALFYLSNRVGRRLLSLSSLLTALCVTVLLTTRASFLYTLAMWISSYLATMAFVTDSVKKTTFTKDALLAVGALFSAVTIYLLGQAMRSGEFSFDTLFYAGIPNLASAFLGSTSAFCKWFSESWYASPDPGYGIRSLALIRYLLGDYRPTYDPIEVGIYGSLTGETTTLFTIFRELIDDFTLPGSLAVLYVFGMTSGWAYLQVKNGSRIGIILLIAFYFVTLTSFTGSPFSYTTLIAAIVTYAAIMGVILVSRQMLRLRTGE